MLLTTFTDHLSQEPDAVALLLLVALVALTLAVGLVAGRRREARPDTEEQQAAELGQLVSTWPSLLRLELLAAMVTMLVVTWWAIGLQVPLGPQADPSITPTVAKAPWFFIGIQEMLQYFDAWLAGVILPLLSVVGLCALPYLDVSDAGSGRYTWRNRPLALAVIVGLLLIWLVPALVGQLWRGENWELAAAWRSIPPTQLKPAPLEASRLSLAGALGLHGALEHVVGCVACLGPFAALALLGPRLARGRPRLEEMGRGRVFFAGALVLVMLGVLVKVALHVTLGLHYLWVTPWFRI
jgi:hypothetical protein